jgi:hypothetical protein
MAERPVAAVEQTLARLREDGAIALPDGGALSARVLSVATRPFSYVAWIEVCHPGGSRRVVAKIPRVRPGRTHRGLEQLQREYTAAHDLASTFGGERQLGVPDVVAFYPEVPALVCDEVEGATLSALIADGARGIPGAERLSRLEAVCRGAGRWLRFLQAATLVEGQQVSLDEMVAYVDVRLERIVELRPRGLDADWQASVRRAFAAAKEPAPADLRVAAVHGDFTPSNIMSDGQRIVAIDLARFGVGSIYYDVTRLYHQLGLLLHKPWFRPATVARLRRALLAGYDPRLHDGHPLFRLFLVQHLLCHWLGRLKPSAAPYHVRGFHRWVAHRHKRELATLVAQLRDGATPGGG